MVKTRCSGVGPTCFLHIGIWVDLVVALGFGLNIVKVYHPHYLQSFFGQCVSLFGWWCLFIFGNPQSHVRTFC